VNSIYPLSTPEIARRRRDLAPDQQAAFEALTRLSLPMELSRQRSSRLSQLPSPT
jgi:hypothetical protein